MKRRLVGWTAAVIAGALLLGVFAAGDASAWDRGAGRIPPRRLPRAPGLLRSARVRGPAILRARFLPVLRVCVSLSLLRLSAGRRDAPADRLRPARPQHTGVRLLALLPGSGRLLSDGGRVPERVDPGRAAHRVADFPAVADQGSCSIIRR